MRIKWIKLLLVTGMIALGCIGCAKDKNVQVTLKEGVLSWTEDERAVSYEVSLGDESITCEEEKLHLSDLCEYEGQHTISIASISDSGEKKEIGTFEVTAVMVEKPAVSMKENGEDEVVFEWKTDDVVTEYEYEYDLNDGTGTHAVKADEEGMCRVSVAGTSSMTFTVVVKGTSKDDVFYIGNKFIYDYPGAILFDVANLKDHPFYYISEGKEAGKLVVGTKLPKGVYDLELSFYVMNANGASLSGDGIYFRRLTHSSYDGVKYFWLTEIGQMDNEAMKGTLPEANELITCTLEDVKVDKYGRTTLHPDDFKESEMFVVADIKLEGKSVLAKEVREPGNGENVVFDTSKMEQFLTVFRSEGKWVESMTIPTDLQDGVYELEVGYQLMTSTGSGLSDNGMFGRRIADESNGQAAWYCEYTRGTIFEGIELPLPTQAVTDTFTVKVKNGEFKLGCFDFNAGEMVAVTSVKKVSGTSYRQDMSKLSDNKNVYTKGVDADAFVLETTLCGRQKVEVEITYCAVDADGFMLTGNGVWGRRIVDDSNTLFWICHSEPNKGMDKAVRTIMEPDKPVTKTMNVTLNKKGRFAISMWDFLEGESVIFLDVTYKGESILVK